MDKQKWHALTITETLNITKSNEQGLSSAEATQRINIYGTNTLELFQHSSAFLRFFRQFNNVLIYVLLISAAITFFIGNLIDTSVILGVVILNAFFGFIQEGKAEKSIAVIRKLLAPNAQVIRDGNYYSIPAKSLVFGDIVLIKSGDKVPADMRLLYTKNLQIQEAILTGESSTVEKNNEATSEQTAIGDRTGMAYSGTVVTYGRGTGVVVATGMSTEIGKIGKLLKKIPPLTTPLLRQMNAFGRKLTVATLILAAFTFAIGMLCWKSSAAQMFMATVGLFVAAIPEGLPSVLTIILAISVTRMARRNAIIRHLPAVETMGAVTTICTDKTGTLTRNEQTIKNIITADNSYLVEENNALALAIQQHSDIALAIYASLLCNDAEFSKTENEDAYHTLGNPIDQALLKLGLKAKINIHLLKQNYPRTDLIPYESSHKLMATLHHSHTSNEGFIYVKGAPEKILDMCSLEQKANTTTPININYWRGKIDNFTRMGYRVIALASKKTLPGKNNLLFEDTQKDLTLIAIFALIDEPRIETIHAIEQCKRAGITVKMITGDHAETATTIANQVGINSESGVLTGTDLDKINDQELIEIAEKINVYARTNPEHKLRLVRALQSKGELIAMTGDGVNDAPALRQADIGVAMGQKGTEIAKESAAMILADDNFATIVHAIEEGRTVYDNLKKALLFIIPTNAAEAFTIVMAILFGFILPITPVQILWINMVTAITLAIALGFEPAENDSMNRPPRKSNEPILSAFLVWRIVFVTTIMVTLTFGLFTFYRIKGIDLNIARTVAINMIVLSEAAYLLNCRKIYSSSLSIKILFDSKPILVAIISVISLQLVLTYAPIMQKFFGTAPLGIAQWLNIVVLSAFAFILVELEKLATRNLLRLRVN